MKDTAWETGVLSSSVALTYPVEGGVWFGVQPDSTLGAGIVLRLVVRKRGAGEGAFEKGHFALTTSLRHLRIHIFLGLCLGHLFDSPFSPNTRPVVREGEEKKMWTGKD